MVYRDMTFCSFWAECNEGASCFRACTPDIEEKAHEFGLPISMFAEKPDCFKEEQ